MPEERISALTDRPASHPCLFCGETSEISFRVCGACRHFINEHGDQDSSGYALHVILGALSAAAVLGLQGNAVRDLARKAREHNVQTYYQGL
jgi:hypothetical protein